MKEIKSAMAPKETEGLDTFFAMVGFFLMVVGFVGAIILMIVGLALHIAYGNISVLGQNMFLLVGFAFGGMAFVGIGLFMAQFYLHRLRFQKALEGEDEQ